MVYQKLRGRQHRAATPVPVDAARRCRRSRRRPAARSSRRTLGRRAEAGLQGPRLPAPAREEEARDHRGVTLARARLILGGAAPLRSLVPEARVSRLRSLLLAAVAALAAAALAGAAARPANECNGVPKCIASPGRGSSCPRTARPASCSSARGGAASSAARRAGDLAGHPRHLRRAAREPGRTGPDDHALRVLPRRLARTSAGAFEPRIGCIPSNAERPQHARARRSSRSAPRSTSLRRRSCSSPARCRRRRSPARRASTSSTAGTRSRSRPPSRRSSGSRDADPRRAADACGTRSMIAIARARRCRAARGPASRSA